MRMLRVFRKRDAGQALVEFGLVVVIFFILVLGAIDVGRAVWQYNLLSQATREGARYAIVHGAMSADPSGPGSPYYSAPDEDTKVTGQVEQFANGLKLSELTVNAEWLDGTNDVGNRVKVSTTYTYEPFLDLLGILPFNIESSTIMKIAY